MTISKKYGTALIPENDNEKQRLEQAKSAGI